MRVPGLGDDRLSLPPPVAAQGPRGGAIGHSVGTLSAHGDDAPGCRCPPTWMHVLPSRVARCCRTVSPSLRLLGRRAPAPQRGRRMSRYRPPSSRSSTARPMRWESCDGIRNRRSLPCPRRRGVRPDHGAARLRRSRRRDRAARDLAVPGDGRPDRFTADRIPAGRARRGCRSRWPGTAPARRALRRDRVRSAGDRGVDSAGPCACTTPRPTPSARDADVDTSREGIARAEKRQPGLRGACAPSGPVRSCSPMSGPARWSATWTSSAAVLGDDSSTISATRTAPGSARRTPSVSRPNVRAMVLDGAVDPEQDPVEEMVLQAAGFQRAFDAFAADCADDDGCPLGDDPRRQWTRFRALVDPLIDTPAPTDRSARPELRRRDHRGAAGAVLTDLWGSLRGGLDSLASSGTGDTLLRLADLYEGRERRRQLHATSTTRSTRCDASTTPPITDRRRSPGNSTPGSARRRRSSTTGAATVNAALDACAFWPVPPTVRPHERSRRCRVCRRRSSSPRPQDPATPYQAGVESGEASRRRADHVSTGPSTRWCSTARTASTIAVTAYFDRSRTSLITGPHC